MLQSTSAVAASREFVVVTFESEFIAQKAVQNEELKVQFGNYMSNIVGFAPEIIALTSDDWLAIRTEYAAMQKTKKTDSDAPSDTDQEQDVTKKESDNPIIDQAQALFGDVVEIIAD